MLSHVADFDKRYDSHSLIWGEENNHKTASPAACLFVVFGNSEISGARGLMVFLCPASTQVTLEQYQ